MAEKKVTEEIVNKKVQNQIKALQRRIRRLESNVVWLYNNMPQPPEIRQIGFRYDTKNSED